MRSRFLHPLNGLLLSLVAICLASTSVGVAAQGDEYFFSEMRNGARSTSAFFKAMGLSRLDLDTRIGPNQSLVNRLIGDNDTIVRELQTNDRFRTLAAGQYVDGSYILLKRSTKNGPSEVYIYDQNGNSRTYANDVLDWSPRLATIITRQQELVCITPQGLLITDRNGRLRKTVRAPAPLHYGILRNHPDGTLSALAIDARGSLHASNMHKWIAVGMTLAVHGDRAGVLAAYPGPCGHLYGAVYKYVNEYNSKRLSVSLYGH